MPGSDRWTVRAWVGSPDDLSCENLLVTRCSGTSSVFHRPNCILQRPATARGIEVGFDRRPHPSASDPSSWNQWRPVVARAFRGGQLRSQSAYPKLLRAGLQISSRVKAAIRSKSRPKCQAGVLCQIAMDAIRQSTEERIVIPRRLLATYRSAASTKRLTATGSPRRGSPSSCQRICCACRPGRRPSRTSWMTGPQVAMTRKSSGRAWTRPANISIQTEVSTRITCCPGPL